MLAIHDHNFKLDIRSHKAKESISAMSLMNLQWFKQYYLRKDSDNIV